MVEIMKQSKQKRYELSLKDKGLVRVVVIIPEAEATKLKDNCANLRAIHLEALSK